MNLEHYKWLREAMEIPSQGTGSPFKELLEKMFEVVIRLEREDLRTDAETITGLLHC